MVSLPLTTVIQLLMLCRSEWVNGMGTMLKEAVVVYFKSCCTISVKVIITEFSDFGSRIESWIFRIKNRIIKDYTMTFSFHA
jgi:hypothetical protein